MNLEVPDSSLSCGLGGREGWKNTKRRACGGALVEGESLVLNSGSVLGLNPTKAFGFSVEGGLP